MRLFSLFSVVSLAACGTSPSALPDPLLQAHDSATPEEFGVDSISLVMSRMARTFPGAELIDSEPVFWPSGAPMGTLLIFAVDQEPAQSPPCETLFCGPDLYSVLASDEPELPYWVVANSGGPLGLPSGAELVYEPGRQAWGWLLDGSFTPEDSESWGATMPVTWAPSAARLAEFEAERAAGWQDMLATRSACGGSYGTVLDSFQGISAYSNGGCSGTGSGTYQCVEFTDRVHKVTASHSGNANTYNDSTNPRKMEMMYFTNNNGTYAPKRGDLVVSDGGTYGHVAIIDSTSSSSATLIDQNWSSSSATHSVTLSSTKLGNMSASYPIAGWLRPGWDFGSGNLDTSSSIYHWSVLNASISSVSSSGVTLNPGSDPGIKSPSGLYLHPVPSSASGEGYGKVKVRLKSNAPDGSVRVYFTTSSYTSWNEKQAESTTVTTDGAWHTVTVDMSVNGYWVYGGRVNQIRVDPASNGNSGSSDTITIDAVWFEP